MRPSDEPGRHSRPGDDEPVPRTGSARTAASGDGYGSVYDGVPAASTPRSGRRHAAPGDGYGDPEPGYAGPSTRAEPYGGPGTGSAGYESAGYGSAPYDAPGYGSVRDGAGYGSFDGPGYDGSSGTRSTFGPSPYEDDPLGDGYGRSPSGDPLGGAAGRGYGAAPGPGLSGRSALDGGDLAGAPGGGSPEGYGSTAGGPHGAGPAAGPHGYGSATGGAGYGSASGPNGYGPAAAGPSGYGSSGAPNGYGPGAGPSGYGSPGAPNGYGPGGPNGYGPAAGGPNGFGSSGAPNGYGPGAGPNGHGPAAGGPNGHGSVAGPNGYGPAGAYGPPNGQAPAHGYGANTGGPGHGGPGGDGVDGQRPVGPQDRPSGAGPAFAGAGQPPAGSPSHGPGRPGGAPGSPPAGPGAPGGPGGPGAPGSGPSATGTPGGSPSGGSPSAGSSTGGASTSGGDAAPGSTTPDDAPAAPLLAGGIPPPGRDGASTTSTSGASTTATSRSATGDDDAVTSAITGGTRHRRGAGNGPGRGGDGAGDGPEDDRPVGRAARRAAESGEGGKAKRKGSFWRELPLLIVVAIVLTFLIQTFVARIYVIPSASMEQTLHGCTGCTNDRVAVDKVSYRFSAPAPGDVVVFKGPPAWSENDEVDSEEPSGNALVRGFNQALSLIGLAAPNEKDFVKRVIATEGQTVACCDAQNRVTVDGQPLTEPYLYYQPDTPPGQQPFDPIVVPPGQLWVMGDNRNNSADSRFHGPIGTSDVIGKAQVIVLPVSRWSGVPDTDPQARPSALGAPGWTSAAPAGAGLLLALPVVGVSRRLRERSARAVVTTSGGAGTPDDVRREDDQG